MIDALENSYSQAIVVEEELQFLINSVMKSLDAQFIIVADMADVGHPEAWEAAMKRAEMMGRVLEKLTAMIPQSYRKVQ